MGDYIEYGSIMINGKKRVLYTKTGSTKKYLKHKGRMMNFVKYKKMLVNQNKVEPSQKPTLKKHAKAVKPAKPAKKTNKKRRGGFFADADQANKAQTSTTASTPSSSGGTESAAMTAFKSVLLGTTAHKP